MAVKFEAVGMVEFTSIAVGIQAADHMIKAARVAPLMMKTICPGKFVVAVHATVSAVQSAIDAGLTAGKGVIVDHFVIPNIDPGVIAAMSCTVEKPEGPALGIIETFSAASSILAADTAIKAASVELVEVRIAMGIGGKAFSILCGEVGPVKTAVDAGAATAGKIGMLVREEVIPGIAEQVLSWIL